MNTATPNMATAIMAACITKNTKKLTNLATQIDARNFHETASLCRIQSGRYFPTKNRSKPLTYEMAYEPKYIGARKSWNSWNTTTMEGGMKTSQILIDDAFIRKFMVGTFHDMILSEVIIKRQHNIIRIAAIINRKISALQILFLVGYTEELLGHWFQCPVVLEFQSVQDASDVVFKYI